MLPAILLPIPGLCPGAVGRPSVVAIMLAVIVAVRPWTGGRQPPAHAPSAACFSATSNLLASPDATLLDDVRIKTMITMHAQDGLTRLAILAREEYVCVESRHWNVA